jgi:hypothetical protein
MRHKLGICIPYRDRKKHLELLVPHLTTHLNKKGIDFHIYVGHQVDDKLFNRGAMKNIAAHHAIKDGCDYIAWHDVDMLPQDNCDYSYPKKTPIHIATKLSKYNYAMGYDQYFGGVVLFNKKHIEKTNGYSNEYWDWGQEDDDLFWRCHFENYTTGKVIDEYKNKAVANFNGEDSFIAIPTNREISTCLRKDHTISILFKAEQQNKKYPIFLVGDKNRAYVEYPLLRKISSRLWGISFNNSRTVTALLYDIKRNIYYNWGKRFEGLWTWVTISYNEEEQKLYFYINNELVSYQNNVKENIPLNVGQKLRSHDITKPFILGACDCSIMFYKGKIADFKIYNRYFKNIADRFESKDGLVLDYDFAANNVSGLQTTNGIIKNVEITKEDVGVIENILPYRIDGNFDCLYHDDQGFVNGEWVRGETTARNERRLIMEMQQKKINHKKDGINNITQVINVVGLEKEKYPNTTIINTVCNG